MIETLAGRRLAVASMDPFGRTDQLDEGVLATLVARFEARGKNAHFSKMLDDYLAAMSIAPGAHVLDIGCGTGLAARAIARRAGFSGHVVGIDLSPYLVSAATRLASEESLSGRLEFRAGNVCRLDYADATFDAVVAHTLLSHVGDPLSVLQEAARVLKPGGMMGIFDGDYASLTLNQADPSRAKADDELLIGALVTNPRVMRQLALLLRDAGLELVTCIPYVMSEVGKANFWGSAIDAYRHLLAKAGVMTEHEADSWASALRGASDAGVFFGSCNYYAYVARRP